MKTSRNGARHNGRRELTRIIRHHLGESGEIVLATEELGVFLGNGHPLDSVEVQEIIRDLADSEGWRAFVFDYGACVRFSACSEARPRPPSSQSSRRPSRSG